MAKKLFTLLICVLAACASAGAKRASSSQPSTTQATTPPRQIKFADAAVPIIRFRTADHDVDLRNRIAYEGGSDIYFGQADTLDGEGKSSATVPLIVAMQKGGWMALSLEDPRLQDAEWQFVATGPAAGEIWGVLDDVLHHKGKVLLLAHSNDFGKTWNVSSVAKPFDTGDYDSFAMDRDGRGRLTVYLPPQEKHPKRAGFYHLRTTDGGKTWARPQYESDALDPADEVPADEEVDPLKDVPTQSVRADF